jgi:radical SAM protein with 4Fe4S-binding SPASM domain
LSLQQWKSVLRQAAELGLEDLHISGGEPTLFPELVELIEEGKRLGLRVRINTNGSLVTKELAERLVGAGLDEVCISIYSHEPQVHNSIRRSKNLWQKATRAVRLFAAVRQEHPGFFLGTMTIILKENYRSLDKLLELHHQLGSQQMGFSYLEGDFSANYLMGEADIREFRSRVVPAMLRYCSTLEPGIRNRAANKISSLYGKAAGRDSDLAKGVFWRRHHCSVPRTAGLIMANGDVHPCNIVEYTHEPVMGNVREHGLSEIWRSGEWDAFRREGHERCVQCPVNRYTAVPLMLDGADTGALVSLFHSTAFTPLRPVAEQIYVAYQRLRGL